MENKVSDQSFNLLTKKVTKEEQSKHRTSRGEEEWKLVKLNKREKIIKSTNITMNKHLGRW